MYSQYHGLSPRVGAMIGVIASSHAWINRRQPGPIWSRRTAHLGHAGLDAPWLSNITKCESGRRVYQAGHAGESHENLVRRLPVVLARQGPAMNSASPALLPVCPDEPGNVAGGSTACRLARAVSGF
jgi:hypothetical protein